MGRGQCSIFEALAALAVFALLSAEATAVPAAEASGSARLAQLRRQGSVPMLYTRIAAIQLHTDLAEEPHKKEPEKKEPEKNATQNVTYADGAPEKKGYMLKCMAHVEQLIDNIDMHHTDVQLESVLTSWCKTAQEDAHNFADDASCIAFTKELVAAREHELKTKGTGKYHTFCEDFYSHKFEVEAPPPQVVLPAKSAGCRAFTLLSVGAALVAAWLCAA